MWLQISEERTMQFSIIPDFTRLEESVSLAKQYSSPWEYNDFVFPEVYDNKIEIKKRIERYTEINRDKTKDTMHGAFLGLDIAAIDPVLSERSKELCKQSVSIANRLGVSGVIFHTGLVGGLRLDYYLNNWLEVSVTYWTEICRQNPELMIYMENSFEQEPDIFVRLMERMKDIPNFKLCLDYGHAILTKTPIDEWVKSLAPYIGHMHLNDNDLKDDLHLVPGTGKIDFGHFKELMKENDIDTSVLLEITGLDKAAAALDYISELMRI